MTLKAAVTKTQMRIFNLNNDNDVYVETIKSLAHIHLSIHCVAIGMQFKQTTPAIQIAREEIICAEVSGINEFKAAFFARLQCDLIFPDSCQRTLSTVAIFPGIRRQYGNGYVYGSRVRFALQDRMCTYRPTSLPMVGYHTSLAHFILVSSC